MKTRSSLLLLTALGSLTLVLPTAPAIAETSAVAAAAATSTTSHDRSGSGTFRTSDGSVGTYTETITVSGLVTTDIIVYTLTATGLTSTVTTVTTANTDGTKVVAFTQLGFGATVAFTSTTTFAAPLAATTNNYDCGYGASIGIGIFTAVDGTTGTLVSIMTHAGGSITTSTDYTSLLGVLTHELKLTSGDSSRTVTRTITASAANVLAEVTLTRSSGGHHGHH